MEFIYKDISINYSYYDNESEISLIFLHGWGQNIDMMMSLAKPFIKRHKVLLIDLPGFGLSEEPKTIWSLDDYAEMVHELVKKLKLKNTILIGHSFGGKISICYSLKYDTRKLVLLASPYKKAIKKDSLKTKLLKVLKKVPLLNKLEEYFKKHIGSTDYRNASVMMRKILVKHVNTDLSDEVKNIKCPTLLIWGTLDEAVKYEDALELEKLIPNAGLVTYEGCTHYAYLERLGQTVNVINSFLGGK